jgi:hypothetical protein
MSDYRIAKVRHRVELTLANARRLEGDIFIPGSAPHRTGPGEPLDVLNDADPFLVLCLVDDEVLLVQKCQIVVVSTPLPEDDDAVDRGVVGMHVEFTLADGAVHTGSIFPEVRHNQPRLVDFLNATPLRFVALFASDRLELVNRAHVAYARPIT